MRIAVNTRFLLKGKLEGIGWFTNEIMRRVVINHPEHEFIFFFDRPYDLQFIFADNVTPVVLNPPARHPFLWMIWFEWSVRRALKKFKADIFISSDGFLSLLSKVPTLLVIHDLAFEHYPKHMPLKFSIYLKLFTPLFVKKATHIVTVSNFSKKDIIEKYKPSDFKISVVYNGAHHMYQPLSDEEKIRIKQKYSYGCAYFVFAGALHPRKNVVRLLQAFTEFKERHKSDMKILIIGRFAWKSDAIKKAIQSHPYKNDVIHFDYMQVEELSKVVGAAYGVTFVSLYEGFGIPILEAIQCHVPGIVSNITSIPEVAGNACIYTDPYDVNQIANRMSVLYTNENIWKGLKKNCIAQAAKFNWDKSAIEFYEIIKNEFLE